MQELITCRSYPPKSFYSRDINFKIIKQTLCLFFMIFSIISNIVTPIVLYKNNEDEHEIVRISKVTARSVENSSFYLFVTDDSGYTKKIEVTLSDYSTHEEGTYFMFKMNNLEYKNAKGTTPSLTVALFHILSTLVVTFICLALV